MSRPYSIFSLMIFSTLSTISLLRRFPVESDGKFEIRNTKQIPNLKFKTSRARVRGNAGEGNFPAPKWPRRPPPRAHPDYHRRVSRPLICSYQHPSTFRPFEFRICFVFLISDFGESEAIPLKVSRNHIFRRPLIARCHFSARTRITNNCRVLSFVIPGTRIASLVRFHRGAESMRRSPRYCPRLRSGVLP